MVVVVVADHRLCEQCVQHSMAAVVQQSAVDPSHLLGGRRVHYTDELRPAAGLLRVYDRGVGGREGAAAAAAGRARDLGAVQASAVV